MLRGNLRSNLPSAAGAATRPEAVDVLARGRSTRVERIVSHGHASPPGFWYDQTENEYVVLLAGRAELEVEGVGSVTLEPGDWLDIPARLRHRVAWTAPDEDTVWLAVFYAASIDAHPDS
jgi:cupin 2 domain-containing protein